MMEYFLEEVKLTEKSIYVHELLKFQLYHDIQIIRGEDHQYTCYIDKVPLSSQLTPLFALVRAVEFYESREE